MAKITDFEAIMAQDEKYQQQAYYMLAKRANQRMRDLTNAGHSTKGAVSKAKTYLKENQNRETFIQSKKLTGIELKENIRELKKFYESKTSTAKGQKEIAKKHRDAFAKKGIHFKKKDEKQFYAFLNSEQFKRLGSLVDSNQVADDFQSAIDEGVSADEIQKGYETFLNDESTFEQVKERRDKAGELLK